MARVQRIESDSSFNNANVLNGTILTYKTLQNGNIVHKAKLPSGSVVEISPRLSIVKLGTPQQGFAATYQLQDSAGTVLGANINIIQDIFIQSASFIEHATAQDQESDSSIILNDPYIKFVFYTQKDSQAASYKTIYIPVKNLVDTYTAGKGLVLSNEQFSINSDSASDTARYLTIGDSYIGLKNINEDIAQALQAAKNYTDNRVSQLSDSIGIILNDYYTKGEVDAIIAGLSNSFSVSLQNYYTKDETDILLSNKYDLSDAQQLSNSIAILRSCKVQAVVLSTPVNDICTIQGVAAIIGIIDNNNNYWPVTLQSVSYSSDTTLLDISSYLAYSNQSSFTGTWKAVLSFFN